MSLPITRLWRWIVVSLGIISLGLVATVSNCRAAELRVATFECEVTPPLNGHPLIITKPAKVIETPLLARGIVIDDGQKRYVLCALDWCGLCNSSYDLFREKIAQGAGADVSNVALQCVHQHTAPYTDGDVQKLLAHDEKIPLYVDFDYLEKASDALGAAVKKSLGQFEPFDRIGTGQAKVDRVASYRRMKVDGKVQTRWSHTKQPEIRDLPEGPIDPYLKTITLAQGDKALVRLHYYATHPQTFYKDARVSYDMSGMALKQLEEKDPAFQIYFTGCAGDVTVGKYNEGTPASRDELTSRLLAGMEASIAATKFRPAEALEWRTAKVRLPLQTDPGCTPADRLAEMNNKKAKPDNRVIAGWRVSFNQRAERPFELSALRIGDVRILNLCGECLIEFQRYAQNQRPDEFVAVAAYGDLAPGYVCPDKAFDEGGYEPSASGSGRGAEAAMKKAIRQLLDKE
ncbi:MAG: hypothetical protein JW818_04235 [Pirellulales bacterium]|nr:hypothetical protein [Pirellulales bacterium]